jgi:hypothetical protein
MSSSTVMGISEGRGAGSTVTMPPKPVQNYSNYKLT